jgi:hypothetical protein
MPGYAYVRYRQGTMPLKCFRLTIVWFLLGGLIYAMSLLAPGSAHAHDSWSDGNPVPGWVKSACCGPEDVYHLMVSQVHAMTDGWHVDGYKQVLAYGRELPSQDGDYWIFYQDYPDGSQTPVYCFFAPSQSY